MGRATPENTQCDTPPTLPNHRGAKRTENVLGNNLSIAVPRAHRKLSTYFGPPSADSIRDLGETAKEKWLNAEIKALQSLALGGSAGHSHEQTRQTRVRRHQSNLDRKTWYYIVNQVSYL